MQANETEKDVSCSGFADKWVYSSTLSHDIYRGYHIDTSQPVLPSNNVATPLSFSSTMNNKFHSKGILQNL
jgi:hypothetical protein